MELHNAKILVIEDDTGITNVLKTIFSINKVHAKFASNGTDGISIIRESEVDLVLCDIMLPDMMGYDILKEVKEDIRTYRIPFIFVTALADPVNVRTGMNLGADDYITKPFTAADLMSAITSRLQLKEDSDQMYRQTVNHQLFNVINNNFNHEFMTPLNGILNAADLLQDFRDDADLPQFQKLTNAISSSGLRIHRNIKKLFLFSLLNSGKNIDTESQSEFEPAVLLQAAINNLAREYAHKDFAPRLNIEANDTRHGNTAYISFIITELADNAFKYHSGNTPVAIRLYNEGGAMAITITNNTAAGLKLDYAGISAFKKFHEATCLTGLGIGLYNCKKLCELIGYHFCIEQWNDSINMTVVFNEA